ncbi:MAG: pyroglutamyl-peptidase I [Hyphomicrobiaceae bacterium]
MKPSHPHRILITGFGPFPGMPFNVSAQVAVCLSHAARARWSHHHVEARELPTEWVAGPHMLHGLWDDLLPDIALHFGVAQEASGLQLETTARNHCHMNPDAVGALPARVERLEGGAHVRTASLPIDAIVRRLQVLRIPSCISEDAGAYLCNAILYESIARAGAARPAALAGFVHIPPQLAGAGRTNSVSLSTAALSLEDVVAGGLAILECALETLAALRRTATGADRPQRG